MAKKLPKFVLVRGIFLGKGFKIAPQIPIENLYPGSDYLYALHPEDAVIVNLEDREDRRDVDYTLKVLHHNAHDDRQRISDLSRDLKQKGWDDPHGFEGNLRASRLFDNEALLGLTFQDVTFGPQKSVFGKVPSPGETPLRASDIASLLDDMRELVKVFNKKKAALRRKASRKKDVVTKPRRGW